MEQDPASDGPLCVSHDLFVAQKKKKNLVS